MSEFRVGRRDFLRAGSAGVLGLAAAQALGAPAKVPAKPAKAKAVIQLFMAGGPPQHEMFDPKPDAPPQIRGRFKPIATNVPGIRIGETLPMMAKIADKYTILRSLTTRDWPGAGGHSEGSYIMLTNSLLPGWATSSHPSARLVYPAVGTIVGMKKQEDGTYRGDLPPFIGIPYVHDIQTEGFLGPNYRAYATSGDPSNKNFRAQGLGLSRNEEQQLAQRRSLLESFDALATEKHSEIEAAVSFRKKAFQAMAADSRNIFDLSLEKDSVRERYGRTQFGQSCLLARRLVEYGVPYVLIWDSGVPPSNAWDSHNDHEGHMRRNCPPLDRGFSALLEDMSQSGLLETTIVLWHGEFGRTPDMENGNGRGHWPFCFTGVVAGGGFKGGMVVGESDAEARYIKQRPIYPWDMYESVYKLLGINPADKLPTVDGCVAYVSQAATGTLPRGGILNEIM